VTSVLHLVVSLVFGLKYIDSFSTSSLATIHQ
jgi:hypothetical protein